MKKQVAHVKAFDEMMTFCFKDHNFHDYTHLHQLIMTLISYWRERFSIKVDANDIIFTLSIIENMIHEILEKNGEAVLNDHQSVQYIFNKILDYVLIPLTSESNGQKWLDMIMSSQIVPLHWTALLQIEELEYQVTDVKTEKGNKETESIIGICKSLSGATIEQLSIALGRLLTPLEQQPRVIPISFGKETLLLCLKHHGTKPVSEERIQLITQTYKRHIRVNTLELENEWKDAALLFSMRLVIAKEEKETTQTVTEGFAEFLSFRRSALFLYHEQEQMVMATGDYEVNLLDEHKKHPVDDFSLLRQYRHSILQSKPIFLTDASSHFPDELILHYQIRSIIAVPIFVARKRKLLGLVLIDQGGEAFEEPKQHIQALLMKFGQYAGEALYKHWKAYQNQFLGMEAVLTPREIEVISYLAYGLSIHESAERLELSPYTVRDYVASTIKKLKVKNRTEAVVKAIQLNLIHAHR